MEYEVLLATSNRNLTDRFKKISRGIRIDTVDTPAKLPAKLNRMFRKKGQIVEVLILDLTFPTKDLNKFIFYIKQYKKDLPVVLLHVDRHLKKESEVYRNLDVYGCFSKPSSNEEAEGILNDLNEILDLDMDKKLSKIDYLEKEKIFACTFKNMKTYYLKREDIAEDDNSKIKHYNIEEDEYYFTVYLQSGKKYTIPWDFVLAICEEKYEFHKSKTIDKVSAEEIGERVKQARKLRKLTQKDIATKTGIKRANIARIESGKHYPALETLEKIADALEVPVARFLAKSK